MDVLPEGRRRGRASGERLNEGERESGCEGEVDDCTANKRLSVVKVVLCCLFREPLVGTGEVGSSASFSTLGILLRCTVALISSSSSTCIWVAAGVGAARVDKGPEGPELEPAASAVVLAVGSKSMACGRGNMFRLSFDLEREPELKSDGLGRMLPCLVFSTRKGGGGVVGEPPASVTRPRSC